MHGPTIVASALLAGLTLASPSHAATTATQTLVRGQNAFAFELYARLAQEPGNLFCSPFSVHDAIAMTRAGARGTTATAITRALHLPAGGADPTGAAYRALLADLRDTTVTPLGLRRSEVSIANALFAGRRWSLNPGYVAAVERDFGGAVRTLDFGQREAASRSINAWVASQTHDRILDLIPPGALGEQTLSVLVNAIYFHGTWRSPFRPNLTRPAPFHKTPQDDVQVPMMGRVLSAPYAETTQAQALSLPYDDGRFSMVILLPRRAGGLPALERSLAAGSLDRWLARLKPREVALRLPRFTFSRATRMEGPLAALGMGAAFDRARGDFSGIGGQRPSSITAVFHKAFVAVDESGTEAAAATGAVIEATSAHPVMPPVEFIADHPFVFLIRDERTGAILFMGRVADPS